MISVFVFVFQMDFSPCRAYRMPPFSVELLQQGGKTICDCWIVFHAFFPTYGMMSSHDKLSESDIFNFNILMSSNILLIID
jgi:hypothetical protein